MHIIEIMSIYWFQPMDRQKQTETKLKIETKHILCVPIGCFGSVASHRSESIRATWARIYSFVILYIVNCAIIKNICGKWTVRLISIWKKDFLFFFSNESLELRAQKSWFGFDLNEIRNLIPISCHQPRSIGISILEQQFYRTLRFRIYHLTVHAYASWAQLNSTKYSNCTYFKDT